MRLAMFTFAEWEWEQEVARYCSGKLKLSQLVGESPANSRFLLETRILGVSGKQVGVSVVPKARAARQEAKARGGIIVSAD